MDIGISTACFYPEVLTEDSIEIIAGLGFKTIEIFLETMFEYDESYCKNLRATVDKYGLDVHSVHSFAAQHEPFLFDRYQRRRKDALDIFLKVAKGAELLGAKHITFHGPPRKKFGIEGAGIVSIASEMDNLAEIAAGYNLSLAWENVYWCLSHDPNLMQGVIGHTRNKNINFTLDLKQANRSQVDVKHYINIMGKRLVTVHINDFSPGNLCLLPGRGQTNYPALFKILNEKDYKGPFIIEVYRDNFKNYAELAEARDFLITAGA